MGALLLISCSGGTDSGETLPIDSNTQISGAFTDYTSSKIAGTGLIRFLNVVPLASSRSFYLKGTLDDISTSSISVIFFSGSTNLPETEGVIIKLIRSGVNINIDISVNSNSVAVSSARLSYYIPSSLDLVIDCHNINNKARVLIWRKDLLDYSFTTADVDTERSGDIIGTLPSQTGNGGFIGLSLVNATVSFAQLSLAKTQN